MMRKYKKPVLYGSQFVMFEMENGWYYLVCLRKREDKTIAVYGHPYFYTRFAPYCKEAESEKDIPAELLEETKKRLQTLPLEPAINTFKQYEPFDEHENPYPEMLKQES